MKKHWSILGFTLIALSLLSVTVYGQQRFGMGGPGRVMGDGPGMRLPLLLRGINLTPEQKTQVHDIIASHRSTFQETFNKLHTVHKDMADKLVAPGELQESDLLPQRQQIANLRNQLTQEGLKVMLEIRRVLTPEQLAKAAQLKQRMEALRAEMRSLFEENH
jgi:Spy/CpxP family protein refolding chaperone